MKRRVYFFFVLFLCFHTSISFGQSELERMISGYEKPIAEQELIREIHADSRYAQQVNDYRIYEVNSENLQKVYEKEPAAFTFRIPSSRGELELQLIRRDITTGDFRIEINGTDPYTYEPRGIHYRGTIKGHEGSLVAASIFDGELSVLAATRDDGNFVLKKIQDNDSYMGFYERDVLITPNMECGVDKSFETGIPELENVVRENAQRAGECIRVHIEGNWELYRDEGQSVSATINYLEGMFNVVSTLYANESIDISLSYVNIWTNSNDPFSDTDSYEGLGSLESYVSANPINGDLAHLVSGSNNNNGGLAWVNVLCASNITRRTAYSNVNGYYNGLPLSYSWDTEVFAHEMGHNVGSKHTQACVWNGNNTQIDDCGNVFVNNQGGTPEGDACFDENNPIIPSSVVGGTIMSYCHLTSAGINFSNGFGQQPGDVIRNAYNSASCLSACNTTGCAAPYSVQVSNITGTSVTVSWTGDPGTDTYRVVYGSGGSNTTINNITATSVNLTALTPSTEYTVTVTAICSGDESDPSSASFGTGCSNSYPIPYSESFESGTAGWSATGTNSSWAHGSPAKSTITGAIDGSNAWTTGGLGTSSYNPSEHSYLTSPCLDLTSASAVTVEFGIWWDIETSWEGAVLQYTTNSGSSWITIGTFGDPNNWYNRNDVYSSPDGTGIGWSGNGANGSGGWLTANHSVNAVAGLDEVKFRFNFVADNLYEFDGLAIDLFKVYDPNAPCHEIDVAAITCDSLQVGVTVQTYQDNNGCDSVVTTTTTLENTAPTALCQDITIQLDPGGSVSITAGDIDNASFDNCSIQSLSIDTSTFDCSALGGHNVTLTVTDIQNITATCSASVTVEDPAGYCNPCTTQTIDPDIGWDIISSYIIPDEPEILGLIDPVKSNIVIIKDESGSIVIPSINLNMIGNWNVIEAYKIKTTSDITFDLGCSQVDPASTPVPLSAGWNLTPYLLETSNDISIVLSPISSDLLLAKDPKGNIFLPSFGINTIGNMQPGKGYQVKMNVAASLTYSPGIRDSDPVEYTSPATPQHFILDVNTGNNASVIIPENVVSNLQADDEIGVFNSDGSLVGAAVWQQSNLAMTIWGNDATSPGNTDYLADNEVYSFRVWKEDSQQEFPAEATFEQGSNTYTTDGLNILSKFYVPALITANVSPINDQLKRIYLYPNPSIGLVNIEFNSNPSGDPIEMCVMDISGRILETRQVKSIERIVESFDLSQLSTGIYLLNITSGQTSTTLKINISR